MKIRPHNCITYPDLECQVCKAYREGRVEETGVAMMFLRREKMAEIKIPPHKWDTYDYVMTGILIGLLICVWYQARNLF